MNRFNNKVALVTGGASGIGRATVRRLCEEGAKVVIADYDIENSKKYAAELNAEGYMVHPIFFNAMDVSSCKKIVNQTVDLYGNIDILVNVVGGNDLHKDLPVEDLDIEYFDDVLKFNVKSMLASIQAAIPYMKGGQGGSIVNIASLGGVTGDFRGTLYGIAKAGVINLTKYVATQYGKCGIRCNAVAPGLVLTPAAINNLPSEVTSVFVKHNAIPYLGKPEHIAATIAFLASDDAAYITGQTIIADGGMTCHNPTVGDLM